MGTWLLMNQQELPHLELDADTLRQNDDEPIAGSAATRAAHEKSFAPGKIMARDLERYGYTEDCPRCRDIQNGNNVTFQNHAEHCKLRIYLAWKENRGPKYMKVKHLVETDAAEPPDSDVLLAAEFAHNHDNPNAAPGSPQPVTPKSSVPLRAASPALDGPCGVNGELEPDGFMERENEDDVADIFMDDPEDTEDKMVVYLVMSAVLLLEIKSM